ncbi:lipocalin family protein [Agromyces sp. SYSU T00266]|uniref:lipocalin family protein n=1 Tax=Agromyces zhanjiangensis TaxID=3158562 RepID=UPI00339ACB6D
MAVQPKTLVPGVTPAVDAASDLAFRKGFTTNSWFAIGHFETEEGETLDFLHHLILTVLPDSTEISYSALTLTNSTTGQHIAQEDLFPAAMSTVETDRFAVAMPTGSMSGDLDRIRVSATVDGATLDITLAQREGVIFNGGTGRFPLLGMDVRQYSLPRMEASGTITIGERVYNVTGGEGWFDRQWQNQPALLQGRWTWIDLNLSSGDRISLWDVVDAGGVENAWATILQPDGTQLVVPVEPTSVGASDVWLSPLSGQRYPTKLTVRIPSLDAEIEVRATVREQELGNDPRLAHYEAASTMSGTFRGRPVTGFGFIEHVADWH